LERLSIRCPAEAAVSFPKLLIKSTRLYLAHHFGSSGTGTKNNGLELEIF
jgi:hypothetical protein